MTIANLGIAVQSGQAATAAADLDKLVVSAGKAERGASGVGRASREMGAGLQSITSILASIDRNTATMAAGLGRASAATTELGAAAVSASAQIIKLDGSVDAAIREMAELRTASTGAAAAINAEAAALRLLNDELRENSSLPRPQRPSGGIPGGGAGNQFNTGNIAAQLFDVGVTAPFMNPLQVGLQQGAQLSQAFAGQTMKQSIMGVGSALASLASPISLVTIGLTTLTAVGIQWGMSALAATEDATSSLEKHAEWLDRVLAGYDDAREAAQGYLDNALKLPQGATKLELEAGLTSALESLDERMTAIIEKQARLARGDTSGAGAFALQVQGWQEQLELGSLSLDSLIINLKKVELDPNAEPQVRAFATEMLNAAIEAQKADAQVKAIGASLGALANMSPIVIAINVATEGASDAIARLKASEIDLRSLPEKYADDLAAGLAAPDRIIRDAAQDQYDRNMASYTEQQRRAEALRASRSGAKDFDQWGSATDNFQQRIDQLQMEMGLLGKSTYEIERQRAAFDLLNQAKQAGIPITSTVTDQINAMSAEYAAATIELERQTAAQEAFAADMEFYKGTFNSFFTSFAQGLRDGESVWESFGNAATTALDSIADRALSMAADGIFDMLFGAIMGGITGGLTGGAGAGFSGGGSNSWGPSFAGGGFTGVGSRSGGVDGMGGFPAVLHPNETVIDHTLPANQNQANDNLRAFSPVININGSGLTQAELSAAIQDALEQYDRFTLPRRVGQINADPLARG